MSKYISPTSDVIDSRDVIERLDDLQSELDNLELAVSEAEDALAAWEEPDEPDELADQEHENLVEAVASEKQKLNEWLNEYGEEYEALKALDDDASGYCPDWRYGETLISEDYFTQYAQEMAHDIGAVDNNQSWPLNHIDWDSAADALKEDYNEIDYLGTTFLYRS